MVVCRLSLYQSIGRSGAQQVVTDEQDPQYLANIAAQGWKIYVRLPALRFGYRFVLSSRSYRTIKLRVQRRTTALGILRRSISPCYLAAAASLGLRARLSGALKRESPCLTTAHSIYLRQSDVYAAYPGLEGGAFCMGLNRNLLHCDLATPSSERRTMYVSIAKELHKSLLHLVQGSVREHKRACFMQERIARRTC